MALMFYTLHGDSIYAGYFNYENDSVVVRDEEGKAHIVFTPDCKVFDANKKPLGRLAYNRDGDDMWGFVPDESGEYLHKHKDIYQCERMTTEALIRTLTLTPN